MLLEQLHNYSDITNFIQIVKRLVSKWFLFKHFMLTSCHSGFLFYLQLSYGCRYSVEKIPLYDSAEDEPSSKLFKAISNSEYNLEEMIMNVDGSSEHQLLPTSFIVQSLDSVPMEGAFVNEIKAEVNQERKLYSQDTQQAFSQKNSMMSRIRSGSACQNYRIGPGSTPKKRSKQYSNGKLKHLPHQQVDGKYAALLLASKEAQQEVLIYEVSNAVSEVPCGHNYSIYNTKRFCEYV